MHDFIRMYKIHCLVSQSNHCEHCCGAHSDKRRVQDVTGSMPKYVACVLA